jgi:hypothetical protein
VVDFDRSRIIACDDAGLVGDLNRAVALANERPAPGTVARASEVLITPRE